VSASQLRRLLCLLLLSLRRPVPQSRLLSSLWPDDEGAIPDQAPNDPAATLRVYVSRLRRVLPAGSGPHLVAQGYRLDVDDDDLDAERFESLMAASGHDPNADVVALGTALRLWRGSALAEFRDEPWAVGAAVRLDELRLVALERLADARLALGQHREMCGELEQLVEDHPLRERFWAQLMTALYRSGRQAEALRAYQRLRVRLGDELGIEPSRELAVLEASVLSQDPTLDLFSAGMPAAAGPARVGAGPGPGGPGGTSGPSAETSAPHPGGDGRCRAFVGRSAELSVLEEVLRSAEGPRLVAVTGEAGIGKTRLVAELSRRAEASGWRVVAGACADEMPRLPYLPFVEALGTLVGASTLDELEGAMGPAAGELAHLFPQLGRLQAVVGRDPSEAKTRLFESCVLLLAGAARGGLVLVLEDFHWADGASVELLEYCRRRIGGLGLRIVIVVTYRDRELDEWHPLPVATERWRRDRSTLALAIGPLHREDIAAMARELLSTEHVDAALVDQLHARSDGSPFLVEELLQATALSGVRSRPVSLEVPPNVVDLIARRVARLAPEEVAVVEAAAVLSGRESVIEIAAVADCSEQAAHDALRRAARASLVEAVPGSQGDGWKFQHGIIRDAVYEHLSPPRRRTLHGRAADALERLKAPAGDIARHLDAAGRGAEAGRAWERAGVAALAGLAYAEAAGAYGRAADRAVDPAESGRLRCAEGEALHAAGDPAGAIMRLDEGLAMMAGASELEAARCRLVLGRCHWERSEPARARAEYETALAALEPAGPSADLATAYVRLAGLLVADRDGQGAQRFAERAVEIATVCGAATVRADAYNYLGCALAIQGNLTDGIGWMDRSWLEAEAAGAESVAAHALLNAATDRLLDLRAREVPAVADHLDRLSTFPRREFMSSYLRGDAAAFLGQLEQAARCYEMAIAAARRLGTTVYESWASDGLALVLSELGRLDEASTLLERQFEGIEPQDAVGWATARIRYQLACGDPAAAAVVARTAAGTGSPLHPLLASAATEALLAAGDQGAVVATAAAAGAAGNPGDTETRDPWLRLSAARALLAAGDAGGASRAAAAAAASFADAGYQLEEARARLVAASAALLSSDPAGRRGQLDRAGAIADATGSTALQQELALSPASLDAGGV